MVTLVRGVMADLSQAMWEQGVPSLPLCRH
jgi:hypothetical protein